jgi:putative RecB family exonuclease
MKGDRNMTKNQALQAFQQELHISYSQIFCFMTCPLKHRFQYVEGRPPERVSIAQFFGIGIHSAIEMAYMALKKHGITESLKALCERFETCLELDLNHANVPVLFKKDLPDPNAAMAMGKALLKLFHENIDQTVETVQDFVGVELPLSATLYSNSGKPTDFKLVGILDLVIRDQNGEIVVIDNKTASRAMSQSTADDSGQMTAYSYLLAANKYVFPTSLVQCQFQILRKLKTPKLQHVHTVRTADQRKRFARIANAILAAIENGVVYPQPSWLCGDCGFSHACSEW